MEDAIKFVNVSKIFPGVKALSNVGFSIQKGEVHALLGENGAGKSTLLNILHGIFPPSEGQIFLFGEEVHFKNPKEAILTGISKVHQEINSVSDLTVGQNITLGYESIKSKFFVDYEEVNTTVNEILDRLNCDFRSEDLTGSLSAGQLQMIEIAKALFHHSKVISFDEPTASLTDKETRTLFKIINELKEQGYTVLYVSHRMEEIFEICDRATILRDGQFVETLKVEDTNRAELVNLMAGHKVESGSHVIKDNLKNAPVSLQVKNFTGNKFKDVNFDVKKGEIVGFFGLVGAGRTETMRALFGADSKISGDVYIDGKEIKIRNTEDAVKYGFGLLPEERKTQGFINLMSNSQNVALSSIRKYEKNGFVQPSLIVENFQKKVSELRIRPSDPNFMTSNLSGGNQQKIVLARWLSTNAHILIFDEPTKGIDVSTKEEIYKLMNRAADEGKSIIMISSELKEILTVSDRIVVMYEGKITKVLENNGTNREDEILNYALGETN